MELVSQVLLNALRKGNVSLSSIGDLASSFEAVNKEGTELFLQCYGYPKLHTMTEARVRSWKKRVAAKNTAPLLESLPPTDAALRENFKRGHLQAAIWLSSLLADPPEVDISLYGWDFDQNSSCLQPAFGPPGLVLVTAWPTV